MGLYKIVFSYDTHQALDRQITTCQYHTAFQLLGILMAGFPKMLHFLFLPLLKIPKEKPLFIFSFPFEIWNLFFGVLQ
jgi:hypothetical protein